MRDNMLNGGQVIVDYLIREKVPYAFGLCGHRNISLIDALHERTEDIKTISVRHESIAGFMADVYYRVSGQPTATFTQALTAWPYPRFSLIVVPTGSAGPAARRSTVPGSLNNRQWRSKVRARLSRSRCS